MSGTGTAVTVHIDGGARGNPGPAGVGVVVSRDGEVLRARGYFLGRKTNNEAEYTGLLKGIELATAMQAASLTIVSDSELLVHQVNGKYRCKAANLKPLLADAKRGLEAFDTWQVRHVLRSDNVDADRLANQAMDAAADVSEDPAE